MAFLHLTEYTSWKKESNNKLLELKKDKDSKPLTSYTSLAQLMQPAIDKWIKLK